MAEHRGVRKFWRGVTTGALAGYVLAQQAWAFWQLASKDVRAQLAVPLELGNDAALDKAYRGTTFSETQRTATYIRVHTIEDGIERIVYIPRKRRFDTPIVMQHGMWHGAWCWARWQELFAAWGWETHARARRIPCATAHRALYARLLFAFPQGGGRPCIKPGQGTSSGINGA